MTEPPMSAEDRAAKVIEKALAGDVWVDMIRAELAAEILEALSSEGLAVVAREDQLTPAEAKALLEELADGWEFDTDDFNRGIRKLARLSGADQDG